MCDILHLRAPDSSHPEHQADVAFTNVEVQPVPGIDGRAYPQVECFGCQNNGHRLSHCPEAAAAGAVVNTAGAGKYVISSDKQSAGFHSRKSSRRLGSQVRHSKELDAAGKPIDRGCFPQSGLAGKHTYC